MPDQTVSDGEWSEFSRAAAMAKSGRPVKQVRLLVDNDVPAEIVTYLRGQKFRVKTVAELGRRTHPDESNVQLARRLRMVLLTNDADLWDDAKHPTQGCPGILFLDVAKEQLAGAAYALDRCIHCIFRVHGAGWWWHSKVRVTADTLFHRYRSADGRTVEVEILDPHNGPRLWRIKSKQPKQGAGKRRIRRR
jgi:hypothetical protein